MLIILEQLRMHTSKRRDRRSTALFPELGNLFRAQTSIAIPCACEGKEVVDDGGYDNHANDDNVIEAFYLHPISVSVAIGWDERNRDDVSVETEVEDGKRPEKYVQQVGWCWLAVIGVPATGGGLRNISRG